MGPSSPTQSVGCPVGITIEPAHRAQHDAEAALPAVLAFLPDAAWGAKVVDRLSRDLREAFPDMKGRLEPQIYELSLRYAPMAELISNLLTKLPWFHVVVLLTKVSEPALREWYAAQAIERAWSRSTLDVNIKTQLHLRQGAALTNFDGLSRRLASVGAFPSFDRFGASRRSDQSRR